MPENSRRTVIMRFAVLSFVLAHKVTDVIVVQSGRVLLAVILSRGVPV